ncbi:hypothetical protein ACN2C0_09475 [Aliarcobacter butzleri]|uniref:hypothetical protein n=1 Tax=Aliarcobacter butzleri TaxID=28197 RepID=UPI003AFA08CC
MKVLQKVILGLGLVIGSVYAQDVSNTIHSPGYIKDYRVIIKPATELKQGNNDINVNFTHKGSYNYILTFSHNVGVTQTKRGSFNLN